MNKDFYKKVGELLKDLRIKHNYTQQDIADKLKVNRSTYANWETGIRSVDIDTMIKICDVYQIDINYIAKKLKKYM